jgi:hypothetical protein
MLYTIRAIDEWGTARTIRTTNREAAEAIANYWRERPWIIRVTITAV